MRVVILLLLAAGSVFAEERVFYFTRPMSAQYFEEITSVLRGVADFQDVSTDPAQKKATFRGTSEQIAATDWLFQRLDAPAQDDALLDYRFAGEADDVVRFFRLTTPVSIQQFQEIATLARTMSDIRRLFTYNAPRLIVVRDSAAQVNLAGALIKSWIKLLRRNKVRVLNTEFQGATTKWCVSCF